MCEDLSALRSGTGILVYFCVLKADTRSLLVLLSRLDVTGPRATVGIVASGPAAADVRSLHHQLAGLPPQDCIPSRELAGGGMQLRGISSVPNIRCIAIIGEVPIK